MADEVTREQNAQTLTQQNAAQGFVEFPKMLYHTDGSQLTVTNGKEEAAALTNGYHPTPQDALDEKQARDKVAKK